VCFSFIQKGIHLISQKKNIFPSDSTIFVGKENFDDPRIENLLQSTEISAEQVGEMFQTSSEEQRRYYQTPLKFFGCIFQLDCLLDLEVLYHGAWGIVAKEEGHDPPSLSETTRAIGLNPTDAVRRLFRWTMEYYEARRKGMILGPALEVMVEIDGAYEPQRKPGITRFLDDLHEAQARLVVVSHLPRLLVWKLLKAIGVQDYIEFVVSMEDGYGLEVPDAQGFLKAALKLQVPPKNCVVFDSRPEGLYFAKDVRMKAIGLVGEYRAHELCMADLTTTALDELVASTSLRRLFDSDPEPELQLETKTQPKRYYEVLYDVQYESNHVEPKPEGEGGRYIPKKSKTRYDWE